MNKGFSGLAKGVNNGFDRNSAQDDNLADHKKQDGHLTKNLSVLLPVIVEDLLLVILRMIEK
ncbi:hypothetical protein [Desulfotalea psychrophila]|uniref:hypothetical protein n=1 Tax=Desulfotalea psychrophila TaxID=84980 RepID=UPI0003115740|nr:hypothetical protein [Desulfotalea psychrophila]